MLRQRLFWLVGAVVLTYAAMAGSSVLAFQEGPAKLVIDIIVLPDVSAHAIPPGTQVRAVIRKPSMILLSRDGETWRAFANRSTHLGEPVIWHQGYGKFVDPISGAMWDRAGRPVAGPAPRGLDWYPVTVHSDHVVVHLELASRGEQP